ncbi:hypothetical protein E2C01_071029 [Portunus trituberculatus]|uniref:Uncharacterized protein n=1 Tax=Portunus trituberculatus TaxID=210409 RepID=A0A5B7HYX7_PORTR|nr:hypothetical protein [Portunus trituberculatus]
MLHAFDINLSTDTFSLLAPSQFLRNPPLKQKIPQWSIDRVLDTFSSPDFKVELASPENLFLKTLFLTTRLRQQSQRAFHLSQDGPFPHRRQSSAPNTPQFSFQKIKTLKILHHRI